MLQVGISFFFSLFHCYCLDGALSPLLPTSFLLGYRVSVGPAYPSNDLDI